MRSLHVNITNVVSAIKDRGDQFAIWVGTSFDDIPYCFNILQKHDTVVEIHIGYKKRVSKERLSVPLTFNGETLNVYICPRTDLIDGFTLPIKNFHSNVRNLIEWLEEKYSEINLESVRLNYRIVADFLRSNMSNLFIPPQ
jgi:hypothetical protein